MIRSISRHSLPRIVAFGFAGLSLASPGLAQTPATTPALPHYQLAPAFDTTSLDPKADPCNDFYQFACGNYAATHPIPSDQTGVGQFQVLSNVNSERLQGILKKYSGDTGGRTPNEQKIGDDYAACMNTALIQGKGLAPVQPLFEQIDRVTKIGLPYFAGELQRYGVDVFFSYSEMQDYKDSSKQIAVIQQGGIGLPERDYYTRTGDKDKLLRQQYVDHIAKMLTLAGEPADRAAAEARDILAFETKLAEASLTNTEMRDPAAIYHPETLTAFESDVHGVPFAAFFEAIHSPEINSLNVATPKFFPALTSAIFSARLETLHAYLRYHVLTTFAANLPAAFDAENFHFYGTELSGQPEQRPRWKRC